MSDSNDNNNNNNNISLSSSLSSSNATAVNNQDKKSLLSDRVVKTLQKYMIQTESDGYLSLSLK